MQCRGYIEFNKELSFSQAEYLRLFFSAKQTKRSYSKACLRILKSGRGVEWDDTPTPNLEVAIADIIDLYLSKWGIKAVGVISILGKEYYDIVVVNNKVKIMKKNQILTIKPSSAAIAERESRKG